LEACRGQVSVDQRGIAADRSTEPKGSYRLEGKFTRESGDQHVGFILPIGDGRQTMLVFDRDEGASGLDLLDGQY